jgi:hypothetical protein
MMGHCQFYYRLVARMERLGFLPTDPVYQRALRAREAVDALRVFVDDIGANAPIPPATPGQVPHYLDDPDTAPGRRRARSS